MHHDESKWFNFDTHLIYIHLAISGVRIEQWNIDGKCINVAEREKTGRELQNEIADGGEVLCNALEISAHYGARRATALRKI